MKESLPTIPGSFEKLNQYSNQIYSITNPNYFIYWANRDGKNLCKEVDPNDTLVKTARGVGISFGD